jgi:hypothetical protein
VNDERMMGERTIKIWHKAFQFMVQKVRLFDVIIDISRKFHCPYYIHRKMKSLVAQKKIGLCLKRSKTIDRNVSVTDRL